MPNSTDLVIVVVQGMVVILCLVMSWLRADNVTTLWTDKEPSTLVYTVLCVSWLSGVGMLYAALLLMHAILVRIGPK